MQERQKSLKTSNFEENQELIYNYIEKFRKELINTKEEINEKNISI